MSSWIDYTIYSIVVVTASLLLGFIGFLGSVLTLHFILSRNRDTASGERAETSSSYSLPTLDTVGSSGVSYDDIIAVERNIYYESGALRVPQDMLKEYRAYLKSARWKHLSAKVKKRDINRCLRCGHIGYLQVHHTHYKGIYEDFNFQLDQLETICDLCHRDVHKGILPMSKD